MRDLIQVLSTLVISLGAGLYGFGRHLVPPLSVDPSAMLHIAESTRGAAAVACGFGIGFITLGVLGLAIPWLNILHDRYKRPSQGPT